MCLRPAIPYKKRGGPEKGKKSLSMKALIEREAELLYEERAAVLAEWESLVRIESYTEDTEGVGRTAGRLRETLESLGCTVSVRECPGAGPCVRADWNPAGTGRAPVLFMGHMDTVFPAGLWKELWKTSPDIHPDLARQEAADAMPWPPAAAGVTGEPAPGISGTAYGPGVCDMKGGIVIGLWVLRLLDRLGLHERPVRFLFVSDEETGHINTDNAAYIRETAAGAACCINLEPGRMPDGVTIGRKGCTRAFFTVNGVSAHSGNDFMKGRNALLAAARLIEEISALTEPARELTVSCNIIRAGDAFNRVPDLCTFEADLRYPDAAGAMRLRDGIEGVLSQRFPDGISASVRFNENNLPFETTEEVRALAKAVQSCAEEAGLKAPELFRVGGSSDVCYAAAAGIPCVCSAGVVGAAMHTEREWADIGSIFRRILLWTEFVRTYGGT